MYYLTKFDDVIRSGFWSFLNLESVERKGKNKMLNILKMKRTFYMK